MKKFSKMCLMGAVSAMMLTSAFESKAECFNEETRKLGRGISNVAFGALEIPVSISEVNKDEGGLAAVTYGTALGATHFVKRVGLGIYEILTFPVKTPCGDMILQGEDCGTGALMSPEFVIDRDSDLYHIVFQDGPGVK